MKSTAAPTAPAGKRARVANIISKAKAPVIMAGNGVVRERASEALVDFAEKLDVPVATTFMAKGVTPFSHPLWLAGADRKCVAVRGNAGS